MRNTKSGMRQHPGKKNVDLGKKFKVLEVFQMDLA